MQNSEAESSRDATQRCSHCSRTPTALGGLPLKRCSRCFTMYCSISCQVSNWPIHKLTCQDPTAPTILIIAIGGNDYLLKYVAADLLAALRSYAKVVLAVTPSEAKQHIVHEDGSIAAAVDLRAVIVADGALVGNLKHEALKADVVRYAEAGGTVVLGVMFADSVAPNRFSGFMHNWGLPWSFGECCRTVMQLNAERVSDGRFKRDVRLVASYSQKAVLLKGVEMCHRLYVPDERTRTQSMVFTPRQVNQDQTAVCWARVKEGWLGYVGDVNCENESTMVLLAMCGLGVRW